MNESYINLKIKEKKIPLKIEVGAQCHVILESICKEMGIVCSGKKGVIQAMRLKQWARRTWQMSTNVDIISLTFR